jgi:hypothetical protein
MGAEEFDPLRRVSRLFLSFLELQIPMVLGAWHRIWPSHATAVRIEADQAATNSTSEATKNSGIATA